MSTPQATSGLSKSQLRQTMRAVRNALSDELRKEYSAAIAARVLRLLEAQKLLRAEQRIAIFLASPYEPNLDSLIPILNARNLKVLAPHFEDASLPFHEVRGDCSNIEEIAFGKIRVRAPRADENARAVPSNKVDVVLLPGLAFDCSGNRLGQGGGWYDRVLAQAPQAVKIGVAFDTQIVETLPREAHDQGMNFVVTEKRVLRFEL